LILALNSEKLQVLLAVDVLGFRVLRFHTRILTEKN